MEVIAWTASHTRPALQRTFQRCRASSRAATCLGCAAQSAGQPQRLPATSAREVPLDDSSPEMPVPRRRRSRRQTTRGRQQAQWFGAARPAPRAPSRRGERGGKGARQKEALQLVMEQSKREHTLSRLPIETYHPDFHQELVECELCLEEYREGEELMRLPCMHIFHAACVTPWLISKSCTCPMCQTDLCEAVDA